MTSLERLSMAMQGHKKRLSRRLPDIPYSSIIDAFANARNSHGVDRDRIFAEAKKMLREMGINLKFDKDVER